MRDDPDFIGVYGNRVTQSLMQWECNRYGDHKRQIARYIRANPAIKKILEEKTNGTKTTDSG